MALAQVINQLILMVQHAGSLVDLSTPKFQGWGQIRSCSWSWVQLQLCSWGWSWSWKGEILCPLGPQGYGIYSCQRCMYELTFTLSLWIRNCVIGYSWMYVGIIKHTAPTAAPIDHIFNEHEDLDQHGLYTTPSKTMPCYSLLASLLSQHSIAIELSC